MPNCYICKKRTRKGDQCDYCETFFCEECVDTYCDNIDVECYACNGDDNDFSFMGEKICTTLQSQQPQATLRYSKTPLGKRFCEWFIRHKLETYQTSVDSEGNKKYQFPTSKLVSDILDFYSLECKGFLQQNIKLTMDLIYYSIVRIYEPERWNNWIIQQNKVE